jgi:hypothetical protein
MAWLVAEGSLSEGGLARLIESGFKEGGVLLDYSSPEFESALTVNWSQVEVFFFWGGGELKHYGICLMFMCDCMGYSVEPLRRTL